MALLEKKEEMNGETNKPEVVPPKTSALRTLTKEQLTKILEAHRKWVESGEKEGEKADLSNTDLRRRNLSDTDLRLANLSGVNLQEANLLKVNLEGASLSKANLKEANLVKANLKGANLDEVNLKEANLTGANLEGASLRRAKLQRASLNEAELQGAFLHEANLDHADLHGASLTDTDFRGSNLKGASLQGVVNFSGVKLGGANLDAVTLPGDLHRFEPLRIVEEASKSARKIFLTMLLACLYALLTIATTTDTRLLTNSASSPLPILGTAIPIVWFYLAVPLLLLGHYIYFHVHLLRLWEGLADLPAVFPDGRPLDKRVYPWLLNCLVRAHFPLLRKNRPPLSRLQVHISFVLGWWVVPATLLLFWTRYLPRHEWAGTWFHLALLAISAFCALWFLQLARRTLRGEELIPVRLKGRWRAWGPYTSALRRIYAPSAIALGIGAIFSLFALGAIDGVPPAYFAPPARFIRQATAPIAPDLKPINIRRWVPGAFALIGLSPFADFSEVEVSTKPPNWTGQNEDEIALVKGARLRGRDLRYAAGFRSFLVNADLQKAKFQGALLHEADLQRSDLQGADLQEVVLFSANLQGANLLQANLQGANLLQANLQGAVLTQANLQGADLRGANLEGVDLLLANLKGADLTFAVGLTPSQLRPAVSWELAFYSAKLLKELGLPPDHNERLPEKLVELIEKGQR